MQYIYIYIYIGYKQCLAISNRGAAIYVDFCPRTIYPTRLAWGLTRILQSMHPRVLIQTYNKDKE